MSETWQWPEYPEERDKDQIADWIASGFTREEIKIKIEGNTRRAKLLGAFIAWSIDLSLLDMEDE